MRCTSRDVTLDLADNVQLFSGGTLAGTFDTLAAAMAAAVDGDTIRIGARHDRRRRGQSRRR